MLTILRLYSAFVGKALALAEAQISVHSLTIRQAAKEVDMKMCGNLKLQTMAAGLIE